MTSPIRDRSLKSISEEKDDLRRLSYMWKEVKGVISE